MSCLADVNILSFELCVESNDEFFIGVKSVETDLSFLFLFFGISLDVCFLSWTLEIESISFPKRVFCTLPLF